MRKLLRGLAVVLVLSAPENVRADEESAVEAIEKLGGEVTRDDKTPGKPVIKVDLYNKPLTDAGLKVLKEFKQVQSLRLSLTKVTDAGMMELKDLKQLKELNLYGTQLTDEGLMELKHLKQLRELNLKKTLVTSMGIAELQAALPNCRITR
jgi:internalin A